jgi:hypothetical protein
MKRARGVPFARLRSRTAHILIGRMQPHENSLFLAVGAWASGSVKGHLLLLLLWRYRFVQVVVGFQCG